MQLRNYTMSVQLADSIALIAIFSFHLYPILKPSACVMNWQHFCRFLYFARSGDVQMEHLWHVLAIDCSFVDSCVSSLRIYVEENEGNAFPAAAVSLV